MEVSHKIQEMMLRRTIQGIGGLAQRITRSGLDGFYEISRGIVAGKTSVILDRAEQSLRSMFSELENRLGVNENQLAKQKSRNRVQKQDELNSFMTSYRNPYYKAYINDRPHFKRRMQELQRNFINQHNMEKISKTNVNHYLQETFRLDNVDQLFLDTTSPERRNRIIDHLFMHFSQHEISPEGNILTAKDGVCEFVKTYYYGINNYSHISTPQQLLSELKLTQRITQNIKTYHNQVIQHRTKSNERLSELQAGRFMNYELEPER